MDICQRLKEVPVMARRPGKVDAHYYNLWCRVQKLSVPPLRLKLPGLKTMDLVMTGQCWVCVDASQNDIPVLAWAGFEAGERSAIHLPIACTLNYYHFAASAIHAKALCAMQAVLEDALANGTLGDLQRAGAPHA